MLGFFLTLFDWMPSGLFLVCSGVVIIFFLVSILHLVCFILDLIPFL